MLKVIQNILILNHKHKKEYGTVVEDYDFNNPDIDEVNFILIDTIKDCRSKYFHTFEYSCVYDIKFTNMENSEEVILSITLEFMKYKSQFYRFSKKIKNARNNGLILIETVKLTIKIDSSLSNLNICY